MDGDKKLSKELQKYLQQEQAGAESGQLFWGLLQELNQEEAFCSPVKKRNISYTIPPLGESLQLLESFYTVTLPITELELQIDICLGSVIEYIQKEEKDVRILYDFDERVAALDYYGKLLSLLPENKRNMGTKWKLIEQLSCLREQLEPSASVLKAAEDPNR